MIETFLMRELWGYRKVELAWKGIVMIHMKGNCYKLIDYLAYKRLFI